MPHRNKTMPELSASARPSADAPGSEDDDDDLFIVRVPLTLDEPPRDEGKTKSKSQELFLREQYYPPEDVRWRDGRLSSNTEVYDCGRVMVEELLQMKVFGRRVGEPELHQGAPPAEVLVEEPQRFARILDLGAGTGICGLAAAFSGLLRESGRVVLTDLPDVLEAVIVPNVRENLKRWSCVVGEAREIGNTNKLGPRRWEFAMDVDLGDRRNGRATQGWHSKLAQQGDRAEHSRVAHPLVPARSLRAGAGEEEPDHQHRAKFFIDCVPLDWNAFSGKTILEMTIKEEGTKEEKQEVLVLGSDCVYAAHEVPGFLNVLNAILLEEVSTTFLFSLQVRSAETNRKAVQSFLIGLFELLEKFEAKSVSDGSTGFGGSSCAGGGGAGTTSPRPRPPAAPAPEVEDAAVQPEKPFFAVENKSTGTAWDFSRLHQTDATGSSRSTTTLLQLAGEELAGVGRKLDWDHRKYCDRIRIGDWVVTERSARAKQKRAGAQDYIAVLCVKPRTG